MLIPMLLQPKIASTLSAQSAAFSHISLDKRLQLSARTVAIMRPLLRTQRRGGLILFWVFELLPEPPIWRMTRACRRLCLLVPEDHRWTVQDTVGYCRWTARYYGTLR